ncbi:Glucose-induced degradation protein 8-like [Hondaea fermentalgiana]|uniref:Glucose-induced degradation protein 8-like n=1 Tax=Hondaea fermentalgiana TaxID=2315210 RepID=A0A2R5GE41_9STRA|nr:Glucose-induced degradation protein 8-like [Hondaea fermentalgiana]|eukprot:GBG28845.1 Glucose-induced degradation protein 8-like [Hondaea fermentalgiana]
MPIGADGGSSTAGAAAAAPHAWEELLDAAAVPKRVVDDLLIEYLLTEGYVRSALLLKEEAGADADESEFERVGSRNDIRDAVLSRDMERAMELTDAVAPEVLRQNPKLLFRLRKHMLIRLIRQGDINEAITFAQTKLAPLIGPDDLEMRHDLEQVMALLIFDDIDASPVAHVLHDSEVKDTARMLNGAILRNQGRSDEAKLLRLIQEAQWAQDKLQDTGVDVYQVLRTPRTLQ